MNAVARAWSMTMPAGLTSRWADTDRSAADADVTDIGGSELEGARSEKASSRAMLQNKCVAFFQGPALLGEVQAAIAIPIGQARRMHDEIIGIAIAVQIDVALRRL